MIWTILGALLAIVLIIFGIIALFEHTLTHKKHTSTDPKLPFHNKPRQLKPIYSMEANNLEQSVYSNESRQIQNISDIGANNEEQPEYPYERRETLFTNAERSFLGVIDQAVGQDYRIFGKVRIADVLATESGINPSTRQTALNKISSKHFDFLLCTKNTLTPLCAIELDDTSHNQPQRQDRDDFVNQACAAAQLPIIRIPNRNAYSIQLVKQAITERLTSTPSGTEQNDKPSQATTPSCPKCGKHMISRQARNSAATGKSFWGCSAYPKCKGIISAA